MQMMTATQMSSMNPATIHNKNRSFTGQIPAWLPEQLVKRCGGKITVSFRFSQAERLVLRKRKVEAPSIWTERHRWVRQSSIPGRWKHIFAPYVASMLDALRYPGVEMGICCKSPQTAITEAALNIIGHAVDHLPGPVMVVYPDQLTAKDIARDRIKPMFADSARLRKYLTGDVEKESSIRIDLRHMPIFLAWSGSVSRLGSRPIRLLILDEIDKYINALREASSESLAEKRVTTWKRRGRSLIFKISTPTVETGPIWIAFTEEAHAHFDWYVSCPYCGARQLMVFDNIRWPENIRDPEEVLKNKLAVYQCAHCPAAWNDMYRDLAVRKGMWIERKSGLEIFTHLNIHHPTKLGFHVPSWISYFVSMSDVAHSFLKWNKSNRLSDLKDFMTQHKAEPWSEVRAERKEDSILSLCDSRPRGIVPGYVNGTPRVAALVAAVDTQAHYFRYVIRAFGYGETEESWLIQAGSAPSFKDLDQLFWENVYPDADNNEYKVRVVVIDAMGSREGGTRTKDVYKWCSKHPLAMPYQGKQTLAAPVTYAVQEYYPDSQGRKIKIPNGLLLRKVDTTFFKSALAEKLSVIPGDPGSFWLHSNTVENPLTGEYKGVLEEYAKEMCAEVFNPETLVWENPKERPNHFWDCEVMAQVGAWELGVRKWRPPRPDGATSRKTSPPQPLASRGLSAADRLASLRRR